MKRGDRPGGAPEPRDRRGRQPEPDADGRSSSQSEVGPAAEASLARTAGRFSLPAPTVAALRALLGALAREADPPTAIREPAAAADAHIADSLSALEVPRARTTARIADVGSGAGFPGLPLALVLSADVDLVEASRRKCEVIARLARSAGADRARAVPERAETWGSGEGREAYDLVAVRAVAPLAVLAEYAAPLLRRGGALVAWKGRRDREEEAAAGRAAEQLGLLLEQVLAVTPFPGARERHLHVLVKNSPTPPEFPRRPGRALKRPLG